jgi:hypothetical protein
MDEETAELIVSINKIKCCGVCEHFVTYEHDMGTDWYCSKREDINLDDKPFKNVYIETSCSEFKNRGK